MEGRGFIFRGREDDYLWKFCVLKMCGINGLGGGGGGGGMNLPLGLDLESLFLGWGLSKFYGIHHVRNCQQLQSVVKVLVIKEQYL